MATHRADERAIEAAFSGEVDRSGWDEEFGGLRVHTDLMRENLYVTNGICMSEVVMLRLWQKTGKKVTAHTLVHDVSMKAFDEKIPMKDALLANEEVMR